MSPKTVDVLIYVPLIPAILVIGAWWLPWERWIPRLPKNFIGPYLLYGSFAAWHFRTPWWFILLVAASGTVVCAMWVSDVWKAKRLERACDWPEVEGSVVHAGESPDLWGVKVTLIYTYRVQGKLYSGSQSFVFRKDEDAVRFKDRCKERVARVHYRPDKTDISVLALEGTP